MAFFDRNRVCLLAEIGCFLACLQIIGVYSQSITSMSECSSHRHTDDDIFQAAMDRLGPIMNKRYQVSDTAREDSTGYVYNIGICTSSEDASAGLGEAYTDSGVTQYKKTNLNDKVPIIVGKYSMTEVMSGTDWVMLEYEGGKNYGSHCGSEPRRANIMVICSPGEYVGVVRVVGESSNKTADCFYLFEIEHQCVCAPQKKSVLPGGLSIGSVVCLVFFSIVGVYLATGFLYQRFVVGAKGFEQIPHLSFWQDFGNLQADGCNLVCRCGSRSSVTKSYRGIGDDQLNTEEDDERDDNLLPM